MCIFNRPQRNGHCLPARESVSISVSDSVGAFDVLADVFIACFLAWLLGSPFGHIHDHVHVLPMWRCAKKLNENVWQNLF